MKKSTLIIILIIYVASVALINFFGLKVKVYEEIINVTKIECINETDEHCEVKPLPSGKKQLNVNFTTPADPNNLNVGTKLIIKYRVTPDNATKKDVRFIMVPEQDNAQFFKDEFGHETGLILFTGKAMFDVNIVSTDGMKVSTQVLIWCDKFK